MKFILVLVIVAIAAASAQYNCERHLHTGKKKTLVYFYDSTDKKKLSNGFYNGVWDRLKSEFGDYQDMTFAEIDCHECPNKCFNFINETLPSYTMVYDYLLMSSCHEPANYMKAKNYVFEYMPKKYRKLKNFTIAMDHCDILYPELKGTEIFEANFDKSIKKGLSYVLFYAQACHYCKMFYPLWTELIELYKESNINFFRINCEAAHDFCMSKKAAGFPTLYIYSDGEFPEEYVGSENINELQDFTERHLKNYLQKGQKN